MLYLLLLWWGDRRGTQTRRWKLRLPRDRELRQSAKALVRKLGLCVWHSIKRRRGRHLFAALSHMLVLVLETEELPHVVLGISGLNATERCLVEVLERRHTRTHDI
jgi:hypothetical protein